MGHPVLLAVDGDPSSLGDLERELEDRYARHYRVVCRSGADVAAEDLVALRDAGDQVALVLASPDLDGGTGSALLEQVRDLHPRAKRALLVDWASWGEKGTGEVILDGIGHGRFDHYVLRPAGSPDELFHQTISGLLLEWAEATQGAPYTVHVVGESWSGRAYEIRSALQTCAVSHSFCLADSEEGRSYLAAAGVGAQLPLMVLPNGTILENPTNAEIAVAAGGPVDPGRLEFDVVIVGAGPAGLSAAVYGASEGFGTLVVDRGGIGGQATSSSLIRNYLGFPRGISGRQLAQGAYSQAWVFGAEFTFMHDVADLQPDGGDLSVVLSDGTRIRTSAVLVATGASYRRLDVPSLEALVGAGVYYGGSTSEAPSLADRDVYIVGGANSAGQAALHLARYARQVHLVVRAPALEAGMSDYLVRQVDATANIDVRTRTQVVDGGGDGRLEHLTLQGPDGDTSVVPADALFLMIGARPNTDWLPEAVRRDDHGFVLTGRDVEGDAWPLERPPLLLETSMPRVFAAGDVRHGGVRRVASAVGEGSIAIQLLHELYAAEQRRPLGRPVALGADPD